MHEKGKRVGLWLFLRLYGSLKIIVLPCHKPHRRRESE